MLSIGRVRAGQEHYYLGAVRGIDEYYSGRGDVPGRWTGSGISGFGLEGRVDAEDLRAVLAGRRPDTSEQLSSAGRRIWAFDLTFSAPKSVSILHAFADWETTREVVAAHEAAVDAALGYLERSAVFSRRGHAGASRVETTGVLGAGFRHRTSRAGDPQLHSHVLAANLVLGVDGRWGTLDSRSLYHHSRTAGYLYQAELRARLTERLGVQWGLVHRGAAELQGIPPAVVREFSRRRAAIEAELDQHGATSRGAAQHATLITRRSKDLNVDLSGLVEDWHARAEVLGFGPEDLNNVLRRVSRAAHPRFDDAALGEALTWEHSTFDRRDVLRALAEQARAGAHVHELETAADQFLHSASVVAVNDQEWTTPEMLSLENQIVRSAHARQGAGFGLADPDPTAAGLDLSDEQRAVVEQLTTSGNGVDVVAGVAGAGKTHALRAAVHSWTQTGYGVIGTALAARAAAELQASTGAPSRTLASLLHTADLQGSGMFRGQVIIVDEAAMIGTRQLARLLAHAEAGDAKVVLVGDERQLPEIEAGGAFAVLADTLQAAPLAENRRQHDPVERHALEHLRAGNIERALELLTRDERVTTAASATDARAQLVEDWLTARASGADAVMLAERHTDVDSLNTLARHARRSLGELPAQDVTIAGRGFAVGDRVMTLRNDRWLGVVNGEHGTITGIDTTSRTITMRSAREGTDKTLPATYLEAGLLTHAYAMTIHKAQGMTCDVALTLASDTLYQEAAYTALSRGRTQNRLYLVDHEPRRADVQHAPELDHGYDDDWLERALQHSKAKHMAITRLDPPPDAGIEIEL